LDTDIWLFPQEEIHMVLVYGGGSIVLDVDMMNAISLMIKENTEEERNE